LHRRPGDHRRADDHDRSLSADERDRKPVRPLHLEVISEPTMAKQKAKRTSKVKSAAKSALKPGRPKLSQPQRASNAKRGERPAKLDPVVMTVIANRLDGIVREMTNTLLRAARSAVISSARDFSCCILTGDNRLLASAEGLPVHIFGAHLQGEN